MLVPAFIPPPISHPVGIPNATERADNTTVRPAHFFQKIPANVLAFEVVGYVVKAFKLWLIKTFLYLISNE
jgi:hypothetical protein